jgi:hypothetical protein
MRMPRAPASEARFSVAALGVMGYHVYVLEHLRDPLTVEELAGRVSQRCLWHSVPAKRTSGLGIRLT